MLNFHGTYFLCANTGQGLRHDILELNKIDVVLGFGRWTIFQGTGKIRECKSSYEKKPKLQGSEQQEKRENQTEGSAKFLGGTNISLEAHDDQESFK